jgi:hypothetical protein
VALDLVVRWNGGLTPAVKCCRHYRGWQRDAEGGLRPFQISDFRFQISDFRFQISDGCNSVISVEIMKK